MYPWSLFLKEGEDELANFIDIPLWNRNSDTEPTVHMIPHRLLKIEDDDIVTYLTTQTVSGGASKSIEERVDNSTNYTFPNKTVKFFVIVKTTSSTAWKLRTSTTVDTADGTIRETVASQTGNSLYTTEIIEGNFNGKFLTIENATNALTVRAAVIIEPA